MLELLTPEEMDLVNDMATMRDVPKNQILYFPEDSSNSIFLLKKGRVKISRISNSGKELILSILEPCEIFGELSITGQERRNEIAEVTDDAIICKVKTSDFLKVLELNLRFNLNITKLIGFKLEKVQRRLEG